MKKRSALYASILTGLAVPSSAFATSPYPTLEGGDLMRLRDDVTRIGKDFSTVMARENGKSQNLKSK